MKHRFSIFVVVLLLGSSLASADSLDVVSGDATWHPFETPSLTGTAFWNRKSFDPGLECNVGYWMSGVGGCQAIAGNFLRNSPALTPEYLGDSTTTFKLTKEPTTASVTVTNRVDVTAYQPTDEVGWFDVTNRSLLYPLLSATSASATFVPSATYGFYIKSPEGTYYSTGQGDTQTHFAVFQLRANGRYFFGVEDMWVGGDWDYNDIVFDMQVNDVPEPATMVLLGSGLVGVIAARRRRARNR